MAHLGLVWLKFGRLTSRFLRIIGISIDWVSVVICRDFRFGEPTVQYSFSMTQSGELMALRGHGYALSDGLSLSSDEVADWGGFLRRLIGIGFP